MCGICGIVNVDGNAVDAGTVTRMCATMRHRGPDQQAQWEGDGVVLGATRLRILDLTPAGDQPIVREPLTLVYNGEVYNHVSIRDRLRARGVDFRSRTDTEVVLEAYRAWGPSMIPELDGMFAFAVWDRAQRQLVLARDRFGVKPLYYARRGSTWAFASEIKALRVWDALDAVDDTAVGEYLFFRDTAGDRTLLRDVHRVVPGEIVVIGGGSSRHSRYWSVGAPGRRKPDTAVAAGLVERSVAGQLQSDVPVGTLCSGGIDSSLVTLSAKESHNAPLHTFSVSFPGSDCDESAYANAVASRAGTIHHMLAAESEAFADDLVAMTVHNDEPLKYENSVFLHRLARLARDAGVIVLLTGEGADEIFGGYGHLIRAVRLARFRPLASPLGHRRIPWGRLPLPRGVVRRMHSLLTDEDDLVIFSSAFASSQQLEALRRGAPVELEFRHRVLDETRGWSLGDRVRAYDLATYLPPILMRQDKMSMAASVESRVPMLGNDLADWTLSHRVSAFVSGSNGKLPLRRLASERLPGGVVERTKVGFRVPTAEWMRTSKRFTALLEALTASNALIAGHMDRGVVSRWLDEHRRRRGDHSTILWTLLALELWLRGLRD